MARQDNLAYDYDYYKGSYAAPRVAERPIYAPDVPIKEKSTTKTKTKAKVNTKVKARAKSKAKASTLMMIMVVALAAFCVLYRGVLITEKTSNISNKSKELTDTITMNQKLQLEIDQSLDLKNVEKIATNKLEMRRPEKYQTVYINLEQVDFVEKTADNRLSLSKGVAGIFNNIKEYLD